MKRYIYKKILRYFLPEYSNNSKLLLSLVEYCQNNPDQRFWQALKNWSGASRIVYEKYDNSQEDTYNWNK